MSSSLPITVVGGGLAGLTLAIALRQRGVPVTVCEAGGYPRHRVCGEFICGRGLEVLRELGLQAKFIAAGAREAHRVSFHSGRRSYPPKTLPGPALCFSRFAMDELLATIFRELGGDLREHQRITAAGSGPGRVRATGRRRAAGPSRLGWIGLKAHARNVPLAADLEMHFVTGGYVGLCRLGDGEVNVCGLFATRGPVPQLAEGWQERLRGPAGSVLHERLHAARFLAESFRAVAGLDLRPASATDTAECGVGEAVTMIPPVTGNGMSMAFESARWAVDPLVAYSRGELAWDEARLAVARQCDTGFARRLRWARWLQRMLMQPGSREVLLWAGHADWLWRACFIRTR